MSADRNARRRRRTHRREEASQIYYETLVLALDQGWRPELAHQLATRCYRAMLQSPGSPNGVPHD